MWKVYYFLSRSFSNLIIRIAPCRTSTFSNYIQTPTFLHYHYMKHVFSFFQDYLSCNHFQVANENIHLKTMIWINRNCAFSSPVSPPCGPPFQDHLSSITLPDFKSSVSWEMCTETCSLSSPVSPPSGLLFEVHLLSINTTNLWNSVLSSVRFQQWLCTHKFNTLDSDCTVSLPSVTTKHPAISIQSP